MCYQVFNKVRSPSSAHCELCTQLDVQTLYVSCEQAYTLEFLFKNQMFFKAVAQLLH